MSTRGWENVSESDIQRRRVGGISAPKKSKYRNVKTVVEGIRFDSKREADYWLYLRNLEARGEIIGLERQRPFSLMCPHRHRLDGISQEVARYVADFCYVDTDAKFHVVDAKGHRDKIYLLKKKWLELQDGIIIEEV